jgi:hypothetical protein
MSRAKDYVGIAAIITALGGATLVNRILDSATRTTDQSNNHKVQEAMYNISKEQMAILEYRVQKLEETCESGRGPERTPMAIVNRNTAKVITNNDDDASTDLVPAHSLTFEDLKKMVMPHE